MGHSWERKMRGGERREERKEGKRKDNTEAQRTQRNAENWSTVES
jgi:hypothetical protein